MPGPTLIHPRRSMNLRETLITTMDQLAGKVLGLVVKHRNRCMRLIPDTVDEFSTSAQWSASAHADDGSDTILAIGFGTTCIAALDDCADKIEAIENPNLDDQAEHQAREEDHRDYHARLLADAKRES